MRRKAHEATFKPSRERRVRIKPAGRMAILVALVIVVGGSAWGARALSNWGRLRPLQLARADAPPAATPLSADASARSTAGLEVWWASQMRPVRDPVTGRSSWMAPEEVVQAVVEDHRQEAELLEISDLGQYRSALPRHYSGQMLAQQLAEAEEAIRFRVWDEGVAYNREVKDFSADGLQCTMGLRQSGGAVHLQDRGTGQVRSSRSDVLTLLRMSYDGHDQQWKASRVLTVVPLAGSK